MKRQAEDWLAEQRASQLAGTYVDPRAGERPFADVLAAWQESWDGRLSPTTIRRYDSIVRTYLEPEFGPAEDRQRDARGGPAARKSACG